MASWSPLWPARINVSSLSCRVPVAAATATCVAIIAPIPYYVSYPLRVTAKSWPLVHRHVSGRGLRFPHQQEHGNHREKHHAQYFEIVEKRQHRRLTLHGGVDHAVRLGRRVDDA